MIIYNESLFICNIWNLSYVYACFLLSYIAISYPSDTMYHSNINNYTDVYTRYVL